MAKIWLIYEGPSPTSGGPNYELPVSDCEAQLGLAQGSFISPLGEIPKFDDESGLGKIKGYKHVIVEIENAEAVGWQSGFYYLQLSPADVVEKLGQPLESPDS